ncbi:dihydroorotase [Cellulophaga fucicola]|uniref:dihydroorotase n=1 Tax=Cellulophaga fucicola TaxID=76595 RepID=UPI003EBCE73E
MSILIKSAKVYNSNNKDIHLKTKDILIKDGIITKIADAITPEKETKVISKKNLCVSIGWLDTSVSFGEPGFEERETIVNGLKTAAKGGFTDIILNTNTNPIPYTSSTIAFIKDKAKEQITNLHPLGALTVNSETVDLAELYDMKNAGAVGFSDYKKPTSNSNLLKIALQYAQNFNALIYSFPMDTKIAGKGIVNEGAVSTGLGLKGIPALAEELQIARDLFILEYTGGKLHIPTVSTAGAVKLIAEAKKKGLDVSCSVAIHNLLYTDEKLEDFDTVYKVLPPLRTKKDVTALVKGVKNGTIDFVTTDHAPLDIEQKKVEFDNAAYGTTGLESSFGILNSIFDTETAVEILSRGRERYGLQTPEIKEGNTACFTLFDNDTLHYVTKQTSTSTAKNCMFFEEKLKGQVFGIINNTKLDIL